MRLTVILAGVMLAGPAAAHPDHGAAGFSAGLGHPLVGTEHLLAMLAIGLWAALGPRERIWAAPSGFVAGMAGGVIAAAAGLAGGAGAAVLFGSVVLIGALALVAARPPAVVAALLAAGFGVVHGLAHGRGLAGAIEPQAFAAGLLLATAGLHAAGAVAGLLLRASGREAVARLAGGAVALAGAALLAA